MPQLLNSGTITKGVFVRQVISLIEFTGCSEQRLVKKQ